MVPKKRRRRRKFKLRSKPSVYTKKDGQQVKMDSTWEVALAERLDELDIKWERDTSLKLPYIMRSGRKRNYIPDFFLTDLNLYVEVKGYWYRSDKHKMRDVISRHKDKSFCILESLQQITTIKPSQLMHNTGSL
jgi:predicted nuclease of restriction endonuclease-like RecB superfamily